MEHEIELQIMPSGNVAVYRGNEFISTEKLTEEERLFVLDRVCDELKGKDLDAEIKKYTESLYHKTFGNGQGTLDEFDWEDISTVIEDTARHFYNLRPSWKPSEEEIEEMVNERATKSGTTKSEMAFYRNGIKDAIKRFNLRPQPKQEWSKEDEKIISEACRSINEYAKSIKVLHFTKSLELLRLCEKLKDIGSPFKPSEEQMGALKEALETYKGFEEYDAMKSLYNDLKKLI